MPGGTGGTGRGDGEEAAWLDLVARFDAPAPADGDTPWPDREDIAGPVHITPTPPPVLPDALPREPPANPSGLPAMSEPPWPRLGGGLGPRDAAEPGEGAEEH